MVSIGTVPKVEASDIQTMVAGSAVSVRPSNLNAPSDSSGAITARISSTGKLQATLSHITEVARRLSQADTWQGAVAKSSDPHRLDVRALQTTKDHNLSVQVDQVATAQSAVSAQFSPLGTTIGLGTLNIEVGQWSGSYSSFTPNPNWPKARVSSGPGDTSLERLRDRINGAGIGVYANVISDPTGTYLILRAASTGSENGFKITVEPSEGISAEQVQSLQKLAFDPPNAPHGMQVTQDGQDAVLQVNGRTIQSPTNFVEDVAPGVDVTAHQASDKPVTIQVKKDSSQAQALVEDFVQTFNDLQDQVSSPQAVEPRLADTAQRVQATVKSALERDPSLAALGVTGQDNGKLGLDRSTLDQFMTAAPTDAPNGLKQLSRAISAVTDTGDASERPSRPSASSPNTSPLFRQAVVDQYTHNMYAEDVS